MIDCHDGATLFKVSASSISSPQDFGHFLFVRRFDASCPRPQPQIPVKRQQQHLESRTLLFFVCGIQLERRAGRRQDPRPIDKVVRLTDGDTQDKVVHRLRSGDLLRRCMCEVVCVAEINLLSSNEQVG